ncbi:unnamed protein product [Linum tenue]|uniref:Photosystem I reaction center subunit VIII n=1 Tax=Linum tenue TaxID=586396 RepID=A0AAV0P5Z5_9ROSI|nr:unnamed protein product [Linum tenue]
MHSSSTVPSSLYIVTIIKPYLYSCFIKIYTDIRNALSFLVLPLFSLLSPVLVYAFLLAFLGSSIEHA